MPIGLTARQKAELSAMLPNVDESINALKRLITDTKDRTKALARLAEAEEAQKRHARDVGIPFNADAFAKRRAELESLPSSLTVEDGQLAAFTSLQRAISVIVEGPYEREGRGSATRAKTGAKTGARGRSGGAGKPPVTRAGKSATRGKGATVRKSPANAGASTAKKGGRKPPQGTKSASPAPKPPMKRIKPLPLSLGS